MGKEVRLKVRELTMARKKARKSAEYRRFFIGYKLNDKICSKYYKVNRDQIIKNVIENLGLNSYKFISKQIAPQIP